MDNDTLFEDIKSLIKDYDMINNDTAKDVQDGTVIISSAFQDILSGKDLNEYIGERKKIGIMVNDRNRSTKTSLVLEYMMRDSPSILEKSTVIISTGTHIEPTESDLREILGSTYDEMISKCHIHRSRNDDEHTYIGTTSKGTEIYLDRIVDDMDYLIMINSVEPHYFAGFTGGRKSILPGIASFKTIEKNHSMALSKGSRTIALEGNPVHEDMDEAARIFMEGRDHLSVQLIQAPGGSLSKVFIGDLFTSFERAVKESKQFFCTRIDRQYDIVITIAKPPMNRTLYQAQKALEHGKLALKEGGIIILVASCEEGIGQSTFWELLTSSKESDRVLETIEKGYKLGYHKAARIAQLARSSKIYLVSDLEPSEVEKGFMIGYHSLSEALGKAMEYRGNDAHVAVIPDGCVTVPELNSGEMMKNER